MTRVRLTLLALLLGGCSAINLGSSPDAPRTIWLLSAVPAAAPAGATRPAGVLLVDKPEARAGFDTPRMAYSRQPLAIDYYTRSEWADVPARMLQPLIVQTLAQGGTWTAVLPAPNPGRADVRLTTNVLELVHDLSAGEPGVVRLRLRAVFTDVVDRRVLATREFAAVEPAASANAEGTRRSRPKPSRRHRHVLAGAERHPASASAQYRDSGQYRSTAMPFQP